MVSGDSAPVPGEYTVEEIARKVGMSPRNIRAHQARKLLPPPTRRGRVACYNDSHVRRLETITALQRQGFNLTSIEAILGVRGTDPHSDALAVLVRRLATEQPAVVHALARHGVIGREEDGTVRMIRPRPLRAALELHRSGMRASQALQVLTEVLDQVGRLADEMVRLTSDRILSLPADPAHPRATSWADLDQAAVALAQGLIGLLTEAFRVAVENHGHATIIELIAQRADADLSIVDSLAVDLG